MVFLINKVNSSLDVPLIFYSYLTKNIETIPCYFLFYTLFYLTERYLFLWIVPIVFQKSNL